MSSARKMVTAAAVFVVACSQARATNVNYIWFGWRMTPTDYAIVHGKDKDPTNNDFYLVCKGKTGEIELSVRARNSGGYKSDMAGMDGVPTIFVFTKERFPAKAFLGPSEMLGGVSIRFTFDRGKFGREPVLAAIARGEPFRVQLPKAKTQLFSPLPAKQFFIEMTSSCKSR